MQLAHKENSYWVGGISASFRRRRHKSLCSSMLWHITRLSDEEYFGSRATWQCLCRVGVC